MKDCFYKIVFDLHVEGILFESQPREQLSFYDFPQSLQANAVIMSKDRPWWFSATTLRIFTHNHLTTSCVISAAHKASLNKPRNN
jgi:hypothetical protein